MYCIPIWGGATKEKFLALERAQRALIKAMYFRKLTYPTESLYKDSDLLSVRKLYIAQIVLHKHKNLPFEAMVVKRRRKYIIAEYSPVRTAFARKQYTTRAPYLYNRTNEILELYSYTYHECKKKLHKWLKCLNYSETEKILNHIN